MGDKRLCTACSETGAQYKCPKCLSPYCSVACYKLHKEQCSGKRPSPAPPKEVITASRQPLPSDNVDEEVSTRLSLRQLACIGDSESLKQLLQSRPSLRETIAKIDASPDPEKALALAMDRSDDLRAFAYNMLDVMGVGEGR